jgi:1-acyl-sn-glycerol-3-phosphate acyltransferase
MGLLSDEAIAERVRRLELPFNRHGIDPYGIAQHELTQWFTVASWLYRHYFRVRVSGIEKVPARGRAMLVGNHSGGVALDGLIIVTALFLEKEPPRLVQGMAEKFLNRLPFASRWLSRLGHFTGLPENAVHLLEDDRLLLVFPEGARGTAKLYGERNSLVEFGTGFMRLAMQTRTPIVPCAFLGGGDAVPTVANLYRLGKILGVPYVPVTPYLLPLPRPVALELYFGEPMIFSGTGNEDDSLVRAQVEEVKGRIAALLDRGVKLRREPEVDAP